MAKKNDIPAAVKAAMDQSPESQMANLKTLNNILVKETAELREKNKQLSSKLASFTVDQEILDDTERDVFRFVFSDSFSDASARSNAEMAGMMVKKAELASAELDAAERRLLFMAREKDGLESSLERTVKERDLSCSDLDEKRKKVEDLKTFIQLLEQENAYMSKEREVADARFGKLEEELQSVMLENNFLERWRKDNKQLVEKLVREMEKMKSQKDVDMDFLKTENKANGSKISALEEECNFLKEIRVRLENELCCLKLSFDKMKEEKVKVGEDLKRKCTELGRLEKERLELQKKFDSMKKMIFEINELKTNMTKLAAEKDLVDQTRAKYEIQICDLQAEISELQSSRKNLEDAHSTCSEKIAVKEAFCAAMQRDMNLAVAQKTEIQKKLDLLTAENEDTKKHINSLMIEKASLEKHLETSKQGLQDIKLRLKTSEDASGHVCSLLKKITAEVMGGERNQENCNSRETGVEVENDKEMKLFEDNLEAIKLAVNGKDAKIKDLNQKLELLQLSVAYGKKEWGIWKWLFPASTAIFAAVSLAYAARAR